MNVPPPVDLVSPAQGGRKPTLDYWRSFALVKPDMKVKLAGLELTNPVIAASGTFGYGIEFEEIVSLERIGGFVTKGISLQPMQGHPPPRIIQTAAGMLNAIGLQNVGVEEFIAKKLPPLRRYPACKVIVNIFGYTVGDYIAVIERLNQAEGIDAYELNVSCPNVHAGGMAFGADCGLARISRGPRPVRHQAAAHRQAFAQRDFGGADGQSVGRGRRRCRKPGQHVSGHVD